MSNRNIKNRKKRGFEKLILISLEPMKAVIWKIFSVKARIFTSINLRCKWKNASENDLYNFFEEILIKLRPIFNDGIRSVLVISPNYPDYPTQLIQHFQDHHAWLFHSNTLEKGHRLSIDYCEGSAQTDDEMYEFLEIEEVEEKIDSILIEESDSIIALLESCLNDNNNKVGLNFKEIEKIIVPKKKYRRVWADYLIYTEMFLEKLTPREKNRLNRICAIARNKEVKQRIIPEECPAAERLESLGGIACFLRFDPRFEVI